MNVAILTSSRADYGIYRPLIQRLKGDTYFNVSLIVFGTHLSSFYGETKNEIIQDNFNIDHEIFTIGDPVETPLDVSKNISDTIGKFSILWDNLRNKIDILFCLGDRYEMFAAVTSTVPYNIKVAHIHGGEVTLGAIDNKFRNCLSLMSDIHFTSNDDHSKNVSRLVNSSKRVYNVGALSLDNVKSIKTYSKAEFQEKFNITLDNPILSTIHPETVNIEKNIAYVNEFIDAMFKLDDQLIITLPNADTMGVSLRKIITERLSHRNDTYIVESFGTRGYFSCIKHCAMLVGNTSSGIIEAPSFYKYAINLGDRQKGRAVSENIIQCNFDQDQIIKSINLVKRRAKFKGINIYGNGNASNKIINVLKKLKI